MHQCILKGFWNFVEIFILLVFITSKFKSSLLLNRIMGSEITKIDNFDSIIRYKDVSKVFGEKVVIDNLNLEIHKGEIFGLIGGSGAGKTTILNMLIGFIEPEEGKIEVRNEHNHWISMKHDLDEVKRTIGFASQIPSFYSNLTVYENLLYFSSLYKMEKNTRKSNINVVLEIIGLNDSRNVHAENLSGGMKKRLDIACSIIHEPEVLVLDEPTSDLDPLLRKQMWDIIKKINERGTTIIMSSHFLDEIEAICNRVGMVHNGKIIEIGTPDQIKSKYSDSEIISIVLGSSNYKKIISNLSNLKKDIKKIEINGRKIIFYCDGAEKILPQILDSIKKNNELLIDIEIKKSSLDKVFELMNK